MPKTNLFLDNSALFTGVPLNRRHFIDDRSVTQKTGLRIGAPGDVLSWMRDRLGSIQEYEEQ